MIDRTVLISFCSLMIGCFAVSTTRKEASRSSKQFKTLSAGNLNIPREWKRIRSRRFWSTAARFHLRRRHRLQRRRWPITCTSTRRIRSRSCTQTRAVRSTWCRRSSQARFKASRNGTSGRRTSNSRIITLMPLWEIAAIRCRRCRICSCTFRSRSEEENRGIGRSILRHVGSGCIARHHETEGPWVCLCMRIDEYLSKAKENYEYGDMERF